MKSTIAAILAGLIMLALIIGSSLLVRRPRKLKTDYYAGQWQELQKLCAEKSTWPLAIIDADKLLDEVLKKRHFKGKTMGERLVAAQRSLTDNDGVWYGHKLRNRLVHETAVKIREADVKDALKGIRQALRDLGALSK